MNKVIVSSEFWLSYAQTNRVPWTYYTVDDHPLGRVEFKPNERADVRVTLVSRNVVSLMGITNRGRKIVEEVQPHQITV